MANVVRNWNVGGSRSVTRVAVRVMPSFPGGSSWDSLRLGTYSGTPPFVGPDAADGACLPVTEAFDGGC